MQEQIQYINVEDIIPNRFQPRKNFDQDALQELAESIKQHGMIQPLVLRKLGNKYEIIAGERRYKAANMIGLKQVPSIIMELDDATSAEVALAENIQRKDLTAVEKAKSYKQILSLGQMTQEELAKKMGKSQPAVSNTLRLLELSNEVQQALLKNKISERHARSLLSIKDQEKQIEMLNQIIQNRMTVRETDLAIKNLLEAEKNKPEIKEETEEIIDFNSDNNQNNENTNTNDQNKVEEITIEDISSNDNTTTTNNIPEFDQIDINNKFINNYSNLDDEAANMDIGTDAETDNFNNFLNVPADEPILNSSPKEKEVSPTPMLSEENNAFNQQIPENAEKNNVYNTQSNIGYDQNNMYYPNQSMMPDQNNMYNQIQPQMYGQNNMYYPNQPMMPDQNNIYNQIQPQMYGQNNMYYPNQPMMPDQNNMYNQMQPQIADMYNPQTSIKNDSMDLAAQNTLLPEQNNAYQPHEEITPEQEPGPQAMIMQHDITGAVAVIRNTIMNLQNNGYMIEMTEADATNKYTINITLEK